jgi:ubiquinone/menaquinone biosynthesis C-methylase UbiE
MMVDRFWSQQVLPRLIEIACKSRAILEERKRTVPRAQGEVLELGIGSGLNLAFYDASKVGRVVGIDPSPALLDRARERAASASVPVELVQAGGEQLPFDRGRFDSVVVTYTLCSVVDVGTVLAEVRRVLRPGGALHFVEHGLSPDAGPSAWQQRITPIWRRVSGNCHLDRDLPRALTSAGFVIDDLSASYGDDGPRWLSFTFQGSAHVS